MCWLRKPRVVCFGNIGGACDGRNLWEFLTDSVQVEVMRASAIPVPGRDRGLSSAEAAVLWSARGDVCIPSRETAIWVQPPVAGIAIDADNPYAVCFDPAMSYIAMALQRYRDPAAKRAALLKTESAMLALDAVSTNIASFTRRFTIVTNLLVDESAGFSSGSTNEYVGRSILWNAHRESVDTGTFAEAFVHEAIHSLLSMAQVTDPWFASDNWLSRRSVFESPWTGARLRIEPFLQACCIAKRRSV